MGSRLEAIVPYLSYLEDATVNRGFRAACLVLRLVGAERTGIGPQLLRGNPLILGTILDVFDRVLDAGSDGLVMNMLINPSHITTDLLEVAKCPENRPILSVAIPVLIKAVQLRGSANEAMMGDVRDIFQYLREEPHCCLALQTVGMPQYWIDENL
jgi:hypothetical protein